MAASEKLPEELKVDGLWWRKFARLGCVYGPDWWKRWSPPVIAAIIFALIGDNRRGATANMRRILGAPVPGAAPLAALRMFAEFAHCMTETMEFFGPRPQPVRIDLPQPDLLEQALTEGRGAIIVTGHFGNWDVAARRLLAYGRPVSVVMAQEVNPSISEYIRQMREVGDIRIVFSDASLFSSLSLVHALRRNEVVAMQLDRTNAFGRTVRAPFFGEPAEFAAGPFHLARVARSPILSAFAPRVARRHYSVRFGGAYEVPHTARGERVAPIAAQVVADFERFVREYPLQWFQFSAFWGEQAEGASGVAGLSHDAPGLDARALERSARD
jgi:lauroyl/myristoyl acyltransferase